MQKPRFELTEQERTKFQAVKLKSRCGASIHLTSGDLDEVEIALRVLIVFDDHFSTKPLNTVAQHSELDLETIGKIPKHLQKAVNLICSMSEKSLKGLGLYLAVSDQNDRLREGDVKPTSGTEFLVRGSNRLTMITASPRWFDAVVASSRMNHDRRHQDRALFFTLDELCSILKGRDVIATRNPDSEPFGLLLDNLRLVRPDITTAQIDTYLQTTRKGVGKSGFGKRWGEIEGEPPKAEIAPSR